MNLRPMGEGAVLVEVEDCTEAHALRRALLDAPLPGMRELIPGQASLLIVADPLLLDLNTVAARLPAVARDSPVPGRLHEFSVVYDGEDLGLVARQLGMATQELVRRHTAPLYEVAFLGFVPGFPYLTGLDPALHLPRRSRPRTRVPAGSVALADGYTGIYPQATPGGWHILGRCAARLFDALRVQPALLMPGDRVRFTPGS
ncbi:MAG TPA: allophanate hydrolase subunit 1 [Gammaproteobacteria bacterium]|nr:allophanate hydrolase subunit 1 [Gammaproteobacteria bacterium]